MTSNLLAIAGLVFAFRGSYLRNTAKTKEEKSDAFLYTFGALAFMFTALFLKD